MKSSTFKRLAEIAQSATGIQLPDGKQTLVSARVARRQRALSLDTAEAYLAYLEAHLKGPEMTAFLDEMTTNFTSFYREPDHFVVLERALKAWSAAGQRRFRIWCAAASTGEEPYTLAITAAEALKGRGADVRLLATDISTRVLASAKAGLYDEARVGPVSQPLRERYFDASGPRAARRYTVKPALRSTVVFKYLNLIQQPFPMPGPIDVIFCRNVMIYFDRPTRTHLLQAQVELLRPGGLLFVGHTESIGGLGLNLKPVNASVFQRP